MKCQFQNLNSDPRALQIQHKTHFFHLVRPQQPMMQGRPMCPQPQGMPQFPNQQNQWNGPRQNGPRMRPNGPPHPQHRPMVSFFHNFSKDKKVVLTQQIIIANSSLNLFRFSVPRPRNGSKNSKWLESATKPNASGQLPTATELPTAKSIESNDARSPTWTTTAATDAAQQHARPTDASTARESGILQSKLWPATASRSTECWHESAAAEYAVASITAFPANG